MLSWLWDARVTPHSFRRSRRKGYRVPRRPPPEVPAELVAHLQNAMVVARSTVDPVTGDPRVMIHLATVGCFYWEGKADARARIARAWPDLTPGQVQRAAKILSQRLFGGYLR